MPKEGRDNAAPIVAGLAPMWLGMLVESHSLAVASLVVLAVTVGGAAWYALR